MPTRTMESNVVRPTGSAPRVGAPRAPRPTLVEVASPWNGRQSPCSAAEEQAFVEQLEDLSGNHDVDEFERRDVTVLITALRCGLRPEELLAQAPGVRPYRLLAAHRELEGRRLISEHAWHALATNPTPITFETFAPSAAELLPAIISQLVSAMHDEHRLRAEIEDAHEQVTRTGRRVLMLENRATDALGDRDRAREIGTLLYDVNGQGAWSLPTYLPTRVGTLVPLRLGALLGDDITAQRRAS